MINYNFAQARAIAIAFSGALALMTLLAMLVNTVSASTRVAPVSTINKDGKATMPPGFRDWFVLGAPLTPNGLNGGEAAFLEFHHVYIKPGAFGEHKRTGAVPEDTTFHPIPDRR